MDRNQFRCIGRQGELVRALLVALILLGTPALNAELVVPSGRYGLDKTHGYITFSYNHLGFSNPELGFNDFDVELALDSANPAKSSISVTIAADSIDSRVTEFDRLLRGSDYFDVENHPAILFSSAAIRMSSGTTAEITGELTIKGVSKPVTLNATLNKAGMHPLRKVPALGLSARATIKRSDWGLTKYIPLVGDEVEVRIEVELPQVK